MPPKGFKVITITEELYSDIRTFYQEEREALKQEGIRSLPAWLTTALYSNIKEHRARQDISLKSKPQAILIIDDDKEICKTLKTILENNGYKVDVAYTAAEGATKCDKKFYDAVLVDIRLPDAEGVDFISKLSLRNPSMVKIIITGFPSMLNATEALNKGVEAYVVKPFEPHDLVVTVKQKLKENSEQLRVIQNRVIANLTESVKKLEIENR
ncbi:MAG: response regulator [Nitrososphaerales archaeon]